MPKISSLPATAFPSLDFEIAASREGETNKLTLQQVRDILDFLANEIAYGDGTVEAALNELSSGKANVDALAALSADAFKMSTDKRLGKTAQSITDWNNATDNGWYMGSNIANQPVPGGGWFIGWVESHLPTYCTQTAHQFTGHNPTDTKLYRRYCNNGTWSNWYRLRWSEIELDARYSLYSGWGLTNVNYSVPGDNIDTLRTNGVYRMLSTTTGNPFGVLAQIMHFGQGSNYAFQIAFQYQANGGKVLIRSISGGSWSEWAPLRWSEADLNALYLRLADIGATGANLIAAATQDAARTAIGATTTGKALITATNQDAARTAIGATATGKALITATDAAAGRNAIGAGRPAIMASGEHAGNITDTWTALAYFDFTATSGSSIFTGRVTTSGANVFVISRIELYLGNTLILAGPSITSSLASGGDTAVQINAFEGLVVGELYRARIFARIASGATSVVSSSTIIGGCV